MYKLAFTGFSFRALQIWQQYIFNTKLIIDLLHNFVIITHRQFKKARNLRSIFSKFVLNIDHLRNFQKTEIFSHACSPIYGISRGFITCHWSTTYHEAIMCKSITRIVIRMWSIFRNSVLRIDRVMFPPKLQFQFESCTQVTNKEVFQIIYTYIGFWDNMLWLIDIWETNPCSIFSNTV